MKFLQGMTITIITVALATVGYELCMTVTTFGGYGPLALITAGPAIGFAIRGAA